MRSFLKSMAAGLMLAAAAIVAPAQAADEPTIGVVVPTLDAQFWNSYVDFMKKGAGELGVDLVVLNADNKPDQMIKSLEDLVAQGVDGIIFTPYWATAVPGLTLAAQSNIPVILTDTYADFAPQSEQFPNYIAFIGPSDRDAGKQMAEALFAALEPASDGKKYIAVVNGTAGTSVAIDRRAGLQDALDAHPEVTVVGEVDGNFVRDTSQTVFESLWQGNPNVQGVWAANGGTATGVMAAITGAGKVPGKDIIVVGMDLNPENIDAVEAGQLLFDIGGHWLQGGFALVTMYDFLNDHKVPADKANIKLELLPLTQDRVAQFKADFPGGVPVYDFKAHSQTYNKDAESAVFEMKYSK
ncbi:ABC transporter substrate-binding protein [Shinella sp. NM-101]|uniref:ABC transporter substrate-binding protein n=1 Tax=Shinella sp. NM-101 TaxID=2744455 RepID=UPI001F2BABB3|nr:ABC transporter substrate-binding protein [Shinella sp. NM-101]